MYTKGCIAMILAGGHGKRLGSLTHYYSKPAIYFGGNNNRIIDFTLNNCSNSGIETIGVLSQLFSSDLNTYINNIYEWNPEANGVYTLTPASDKSPYSGTADAVYKNIEFVDRFNPDNVLILSGDHIYKMDYKKIINFHQKKGAALTVAATPVPKEEASRFGILNADDTSSVYGFEEKPFCPKSNLASMGIYVFKWSTLKKYLLIDSGDTKSRHDFGKNILPRMLYNCESVYTYMFNQYWKDVGTVDSLWEANMDQIVYRTISDRNAAGQSIIADGCSIFGKVEHSVLGCSVTIGKGSEIVNSVIMPNVYIGSNVKIYNTIVGANAIIMDDTEIGTDKGTDFFIDRKICSNGISLVSPWLYIGEGIKFRGNSHIYKELLEEWNSSIGISKFSVHWMFREKKSNAAENLSTD